MLIFTFEEIAEKGSEVISAPDQIVRGHGLLSQVSPLKLTPHCGLFYSSASVSPSCPLTRYKASAPCLVSTDMTDMPVDAAMTNTTPGVRSRALSTSSDRPSAICIYNLMSPPLSVSPQPAFIAASAASQIVTNNHDSHSENWYDQVGIDPSSEISLVSNGALLLANNFVDHLLFNILATAKSTTLSLLRSAVVDVLKPKLARDVMNVADEELKEYLGGGGVETLSRAPPPETSGDWDLELVWKRTRLRCMVYSSLGDMEEEDEDYHMQQEQLNGEVDGALTGLVSPPVAIFLTSILECMGEQVIILAGQAAFTRLKTNYEKELKDGTRIAGTVAERIVVEELDMERVALDRTLGRLWRAWKKKIRSPAEPNSSRPFSRSPASAFGASSQRGDSIVTELPAALPSQRPDTKSPPTLSHGDGGAAQELFTGVADAIDPSAFPLPVSDRESVYDGQDEQDGIVSRPKSWTVEHSSIHHGSIKRTSSLPCRKKPRNISATNERHPDVENNTLNVECLEKAELIPSPETQIKGNAAHNYPDIIADVTAWTNIREDDLYDTKNHESDSEIEEFTEEPEILTTSRISVGGGSSPTTSEPGRPTSIILTRSNSAGSVRVIEVPGPRSRASSTDSNSLSPIPRAVGNSREGNVSQTPPIVEENDPSALGDDSVATTTASNTEGHDDIGVIISLPPRNRSPHKVTSRPIHSHASTPTKMTVIANNQGSSREDRFDGFQRPISGLRSPPLPTLPERSPSRPIYIPPITAQRLVPESPKLARSLLCESPSSTRFKPRRTSEESSATPADVARNFEQLIQSNETLQYTLTPENMRDIDSHSSQSNNSPKASYRSGRSDDAMTGGHSRSSSIRRSISFGRSAGSHPTDTMVNGKFTAGSLKGLQSVPPRTHMGPPPQARDARISRESIQDFADFIRSTGPPGESVPRTNRPPTASSSTGQSINGMSTLKKTHSVEVRRGNKLQARDAITTSSKESSELIDFIRRGPPSINGSNPRIPRAVAPFRNTQDSDYMTGAVGGKAVDAVISNVRTSLASTIVTETSAPSSMNSQSALLNRSNLQQPHTGNGVEEDEVVPKRTRRRVRDPYAVDFSDEEDDDYEAMTKPPRQEESLIDFLNNYPPPAEPPTQPTPMPKTKSSTPNLIARLKAGPSASYRSSHSRKGSSISEGRSRSSRMGPRASHTPIVIPTVTEKFNSSATTPDSPRHSTFKSISIKRLDSRDASVSNPKTSDLTDYLRGSQTQSQIIAIPPEEKVSSSFARIFERRKKSVVY
ncbi:hypothetical protein GGS21DRAFT_504507 [Xylaria nigripes]|nr:hypothetical protein GGS21DRAFT_504507 [Xylaria nigripes]